MRRFLSIIYLIMCGIYVGGIIKYSIVAATLWGVLLFGSFVTLQWKIRDDEKKGIK